jgi:hypothetical protein
MYLMTSTGCGISAKQLERELGVTYKTAHRMLKMIQAQLTTQDDGEPLKGDIEGDIEVDETSNGGKLRLSDRAEWKDAPTRAERRMASQRVGHKKALRVRRDRALRQGSRLSAAKNLCVSREIRTLNIEGPWGSQAK